MKSDLEVPDEWEINKLNQIAEIRRGASPRPIGNKKYFDEKGRGWIRISDVTRTYKYLKKTSQYLSELGVKNSVPVNPGDLIMSICATIGKPIIVDMPACIHDGFVLFKDLKKEINKEFLFYVLQKKENELTSKRQSGTQGNLNTTIVGNVRILKPPLNEQEKIVTILSKVDEQIDLTEKIISKTEELKKGLMQKLLTKGIGHHHLKDRRIGLKDYKLPDNWEVKKIEETSFLKGRIGWQGLTTKEYLNKGDFILVTGTDFKEGRINWDTCVYIEENRYQMDQNIQLKNEDILVTKDGTIGKIAYVDTIPKPATLNSGIFVLRPIDGAFYPKFFYYILKSFYFDYFMNILKAGSTISHLYQRDFVKFKFPFPSITEQKQIALILSKVDEQIQDNNKELNRLNELKKGLMQDLLTGKVRVTV